MTGPLNRANDIAKATGTDSVTLDYAGRFLRRKRLVSDGGRAFLVDLAQTVSLDEGDAFALDDGSVIDVRCADESLIRIAGDLTRAAWHIGNRHAPCQMEADHLLIQHDPIIESMLKLLDMDVTHIVAPFRPERGAYGQGRTHGHDHSHMHAQGHAHDHHHE